MGAFMAQDSGRYPLWTVFDLTPTNFSFANFTIPQPGRYRVILIGNGGNGGFGSASGGLPGAGGGGGGDVKDAWGDFSADTGVVIQRRMVNSGTSRGFGYEVARTGASNVSALGGYHGQSNLDGGVGGADGADGAGFADGKGGDGGASGSPGNAGGQRSSSVLDAVFMRFAWAASGAGGSATGGGGGGDGVTLRGYPTDSIPAAPTFTATDGTNGAVAGKAGTGYGAGGGGAGRGASNADGGTGAVGGVFLIFMGT